MLCQQLFYNNFSRGVFCFPFSIFHVFSWKMDVEKSTFHFPSRGHSKECVPPWMEKWNKTWTRRNAARTSQTADRWSYGQQRIVVFRHCIILHFRARGFRGWGRLARTPTGRARGCAFDGWTRARSRADPSCRPSDIVRAAIIQPVLC